MIIVLRFGAFVNRELILFVLSLMRKNEHYKQRAQQGERKEKKAAGARLRLF